MTFTSVTTNRAKFRFDGLTCYYEIDATGTTGGTASTSLQATHGITPLAGSSGVMECRVTDTIGIGGFAFFDATNIIARKYDRSNFGLDTARNMTVSGSIIVG
jgi:flavin reductase (DIM6/NTAB) family NADH-FMN oxidoreductase RutF